MACIALPLAGLDGSIVLTLFPMEMIESDTDRFFGHSREDVIIFSGHSYFWLGRPTITNTAYAVADSLCPVSLQANLKKKKNGSLIFIFYHVDIFINDTPLKFLKLVPDMPWTDIWLCMNVCGL